VIAAVALAAAAAAAAVGVSGVAPPGVVAGCSSSSGASYPGAFTRSSNLVVGPLAIVGAGGTASFDPAVGGNKFPLLVKAGHRVTLELSSATRAAAGLAYGPLPQGALSLRDAHRVVTFVACAGGAPTFWSGGILATSARCVPLRVWIDGARRPRDVVVHFGTSDCR
jgi:hypothetical protein